MTAPKPPHDPPSGDGDSPDDLARRFLDLWQEHWTATLTDPETLRGWAALFDPARIAAGFGGLAGDDAPRPPAAAAASGRRGGELDERDRRIAALEERVARLEAAVAGTAAPRRRTPRKPAA
ncbi:hypothetical protein [Inquilinus limosus]|uniref:hypothetical protein n=1 Tax=Inquilinus limosus TaxID=171674 RepID=UPI003F5CEFBF